MGYMRVLLAYNEGIMTVPLGYYQCTTGFSKNILLCGIS